MEFMRTLRSHKIIIQSSRVGGGEGHNWGTWDEVLWGSCCEGTA